MASQCPLHPSAPLGPAASQACPGSSSTNRVSPVEHLSRFLWRRRGHSPVAAPSVVSEATLGRGSRLVPGQVCGEAQEPGGCRRRGGNGHAVGNWHPAALGFVCGKNLHVLNNCLHCKYVNNKCCLYSRDTQGR